MLIPLGQELAGCFIVGMNILGVVLGLAGCVFACLRSVQVKDWFVPVSPLAFLHGWKAVLGSRLLILLSFPYRYFFLLSADNYSSKIGRELFVFLLYCKYFTCQTITLEIIKTKESCFVPLKHGLPLMVSSSGVGLFCFTCPN